MHYKIILPTQRQVHIIPYIEKEDIAYRKALEPEPGMKLTIALRHMATGDSYATLGIGISCCHMTQGDSKFHPWFKCIYIVGVFFIVCVCVGGGGGGREGGRGLMGWCVQEVPQTWVGWFSRSCRRTLDHPGGAPSSTDDNIPRLFFFWVSASSSPNKILVFLFSYSTIAF